MGENSKIEWTHHTFNPWVGCTKVSDGCANCYAESWAKRSGLVSWGKGQERRRTSATKWREPVKWDREAEECVARSSDYERPRVFCASLADWLDDEAPLEWLADLVELIRTTPNLDWLLLTKRPENFQERMSSLAQFREVGSPQFLWELSWLNGHPPGNVWIGTTTENQPMAEQRIPFLLRIPATVRFLSCEPLLGALDLAYACFNGADSFGTMPGIDWVIAGGESGAQARPMEPEWARGIRDQCRLAEVPFFFKQWGGRAKKAAGRILDGVTHAEFPTANVQAEARL